MKGQWLCRVRLCDPMDYTVHGILQARILEGVAFHFSKGSSQPRDRIQVSPTLQADSFFFLMFLKLIYLFELEANYFTIL